MTAGRKPLPTNVRVLTGNAGRRPLPTNEPRPAVVCPDPPEGLCDVGQNHWRYIAPKLAALRLLTEVDLVALRLYCETYARWCEATRVVRDNGIIIRSPKGFPMQSPALAIANKAQEQMVKLLIEFGMTPSSRTRVRQVDGGGDEWTL